MVEAQNPDFSRGLGVLSARAPHFRPGFAARVNGSVAKARWLALGVVLLLGVSTAVAAVRNSDDGNGNGHDEAPAAAPAPAVEPDEAPAQAGAGDQGAPGEAPAIEAPMVEEAPPAADSAPVKPSPAPRRLGDRSVSRAAPPGAAAPAPAAAASPAPEGDAGFERSAAPPPPPAGSNEPAPPPSDPETDDPEATPKPPPGALVDVTAAIRFEPVRFVVVVASNPEPEVDVTVGNDKVVGDEPPPERTEVGIGGDLFPPSAQSDPPWQGRTAA